MKQTLKEKVESILSKYPETRNCDLVLTKRIWVEYHSELLVPNIKMGILLPLDNFEKMPREDHISRVRRKFQEEGHYMPTDESIVKKRKLNEELWRRKMKGTLF